MGFPVEFNWALVLKDDNLEHFNRYFDLYGRSSPSHTIPDISFVKEGFRVYPVGHRIELCLRHATSVAGTALVVSSLMDLDTNKTVITVREFR